MKTEKEKFLEWYYKEKADGLISCGPFSDKNPPENCNDESIFADINALEAAPEVENDYI